VQTDNKMHVRPTSFEMPPSGSLPVRPARDRSNDSGQPAGHAAHKIGPAENDDELVQKTQERLIDWARGESGLGRVIANVLIGFVLFAGGALALAILGFLWWSILGGTW
jgi:hypothetical protein